MKIYTRTGDDGTTGILGGDRRKKSDLVIQALGDIDELNAAIGLAISSSSTLQVRLEEIQSRLFDLGAEVASLSEDDRFLVAEVEGEVLKFEAEMDAADEELLPLTNFILPGGTQSSAALHVARAVCRRAERSLVAVRENSELRPECVQLLNRLADWLFTMARLENFRAGTPDSVWRKK